MRVRSMQSKIGLPQLKHLNIIQQSISVTLLSCYRVVHFPYVDESPRSGLSRNKNGIIAAFII